MLPPSRPADMTTIQPRGRLNTQVVGSITSSVTAQTQLQTRTIVRRSKVPPLRPQRHRFVIVQLLRRCRRSSRGSSQGRISMMLCLPSRRETRRKNRFQDGPGISLGGDTGDIVEPPQFVPATQMGRGIAFSPPIAGFERFLGAVMIPRLGALVAGVGSIVDPFQKVGESHSPPSSCVGVPDTPRCEGGNAAIAVDGGIGRRIRGSTAHARRRGSGSGNGGYRV